MNISRKQKLAAGLGIAVSGLLASGIAAASWSSSVSNAGATGKAQSMSFSVAGDTATADVYPGQDGSLTVKVTNNRPFAIKVTGLDTSSATFTTASGCDAVFTGKSVTSLAQTVNPNSSATFTVPAAYTWNASTGSNNACQGTDVAVTSATVSATAF